MSRLLVFAVVAATLLPAAGAHAATASQRTCTETMVPMDDGVHLHAWVSRLAPDRPRPVLFMMDSYSRSGTGNATTGNADGSCPTALPDDYVPQWLSQSLIDRFTLVQVAYRGTGKSEGAFDMTAPRTQRDVQEAIDWTSTQPWSDGTAMAVGESGTGFAAFHALRDRHLKAALIFTSCADMYRCFYRGGEYNSLADVYLGVSAGDWARIGSGDPMAGAAFAQMLAQSKSDAVDDDFWQRRSALSYLPQVRIPVMYTTDLYDIVQPFDALQLTPNARFVYGMGHQSAPTVTAGGDRYESLVRGPVDRFVAHYGLGDANGAQHDPRVTLLTNTGSFDQFHAGHVLVRGEKAWPLPSTRWTKLFLGAGTLGTAPPAAGAAADTSPLLGGARPDLRTTAWTGTAQTDLSNEERTALTYTTPAFKTPLEVTGPLALRLFAISTAPDFDWSVRIADVWPDGTSQWITDGYLRASLRKVDASRSLHDRNDDIVRPWLTYDSPVSVPLGQPVDYELDVIGTSNVFAAGHRLRLDVMPVSDAEADSMRTGGAGAIQLLHDADHPSSLMVPVIPSSCQRGTPLVATTPGLSCAASYRDAVGS
jgi:predicted acyl esterase